MSHQPVSTNQQRLHTNAKYWTIVRSVRALATFPVVAIAAIFLIELASGRLATFGDRLPMLVIGTCIASSATSMLYTIVSLQRLRRELGYRGELWASEELRQLSRDVIGVGRKTGRS